MSSTIRPILGSRFIGGGGGVEVDAEAVEAASAAKYLTLRVHEYRLKGCTHVNGQRMENVG